MLLMIFTLSDVNFHLQNVHKMPSVNADNIHTWDKPSPWSANSNSVHSC